MKKSILLITFFLISCEPSFAREPVINESIEKDFNILSFQQQFSDFKYTDLTVIIDTIIDMIFEIEKDTRILCSFYDKNKIYSVKIFNVYPPLYQKEIRFRNYEGRAIIFNKYKCIKHPKQW